MPNFAVRWLECAGDNLQQCRLATAVWPNDADYLTFVDFKRDILQRPELFVSPQTAPGQGFLQTIARPRIGPILLGDVFNAKGRHRLKCIRSQEGEAREGRWIGIAPHLNDFSVGQFTPGNKNELVSKA